MKEQRMSMKTVFHANSAINDFSPPSTPTSQLQHSGRAVTENHERRVVLEIVDKIFDEKTGICSVSSSSCSTPKCASTEYLLDKRLKYWKDILEERKRIAERIENAVGKNKDDILFQRRSTVEERDKQMVKRVMDYGNRLNPVALSQKRYFRLKEYCHPLTCRTVNEITETLPKAELDLEKHVEIIGMPNTTKEEQLGKPLVMDCKQKSWLESKVLQERIETKREDIERVVGFYPDIDNLVVIGDALLKPDEAKHNPDIELIEKHNIKSISSETLEVPLEDCKCEVKLVRSDEPVTFGIKVNEHVFVTGMKRSSQHVEVEMRFECYPFETVLKRVLALENIGEKVLNVEFIQKNYYNKVQPLLRCTDEEFVFERSPFRLVSGEKREIFVLYRPRKVDVVKQQWLLKVDPQFFCRKSDAIILKLSGRCKPPVEYVEKINGLLHDVIEKSNMKMMRKLGNNLATLTPLIKPAEVICPYRRTLDERELFEKLNVGYVCERYHDLELLKDIHKRLKKPREPAWDLKLNSLNELIMRVDSADRRALIFSEMMGIVENMKGVPIELEKKIDECPERDRSRFLFVRGIICTAIDEWEELTINTEEVFVNQAIGVYNARDELKESEAGEEEEDEEGGAGGDNVPYSMMPSLSFLDGDENALREYMTKKVRRQKPFRDSLFVQTYTHLCNFVEDIVSVIESTEIV